MRLLVLLGVLGLSLTALWHRSVVQAALTGVKAPALVGRRAPELPAGTRTVDGAALRLADLKGRVVLLHFWTFACGNCHHMLPSYTRWADQFGAKGLSVVGIHTPELPSERDPKALAAFIRKENLRWPIVSDDKEQIWNSYDVNAWPTIILIDRQGTIAATFIGDDQSAQIEAALTKLL